MPITPFHFGPAAVIKVIAPRYFSFMVFGLTQIVIDLEPFFYMVQGMWPIHRFFHTYLGATIVALVVAVFGRPICIYVIRFWNGRLSPSQQSWLGLSADIKWVSALSGSLFGAYSHVFFDSIMHSDIRPLAPFSDYNSLYRVITIEQLYDLCAILGVLGASVFVIILLRKKRSAAKLDSNS